MFLFEYLWFATENIVFRYLEKINLTFLGPKEVKKQVRGNLNKYHRRATRLLSEEDSYIFERKTSKIQAPYCSIMTFIVNSISYQHYYLITKNKLCVIVT